MTNLSDFHAYLFIGQNSIAANMALDLATRITEKPVPHMDTVQFDASEGEGIEGIRDVLRLASLMPVSSPKKAVILTNMDLANPQMLNGLLKNLEEPPSHTVFILQSSRPLIPTIMSRCHVINVAKVDGARGEMVPELAEALEILQKNRSAGLAERLALVNKLAELDDALLTQVIESWLQLQTEELKRKPEKYKAVRITMDTLQALRGNFNKKMVLQNFVTLALV